jgi:tRNA-splicing ligase RtcB
VAGARRDRHLSVAGSTEPARIDASGPLFRAMDQGVFEQVANVACLPGIARAALCMPDGHRGHGFPIGGVAGDAGFAYVDPGTVVDVVDRLGISRSVVTLTPIGNAEG